MRLLVIPFVLAACTDSYGALSIDPAGSPPLGVGLAQRYEVTQDLCEAGPDGGCGNPVSPNQLAATATGAAITISEVTPFDGRRASITLTGAAAGTAVVALTGNDDVTTSFPFDIQPVATTSLYVRRGTDPVFGTVFPDVHGPIQAFVGSKIAIAQTNLGPDQSPRTGSAPLVLDAGTTGVAYDPACECYVTGSIAGASQLVAPLATVELDVVGADAIADFTIDNQPATTIEFVATPATNEVFLIPNDASSRPIVGRGPEPVATIADPTIAYFYSDTGSDVRSLNVVASKPGTTTLDVTWGPIHKTFTLHVVPL